MPSKCGKWHEELQGAVHEGVREGSGRRSWLGCAVRGSAACWLGRRTLVLTVGLNLVSPSS